MYPPLVIYRKVFFDVASGLYNGMVAAIGNGKSEYGVFDTQTTLHHSASIY